MIGIGRAAEMGCLTKKRDPTPFPISILARSEWRTQYHICGSMMRTFFQIRAPETHEYARFSRRGTWIPEPCIGVCGECGMTRQERVPPLIIEWEPDSDIVGDFAWGGFCWELVCRREVGEELRTRFTGFKLSPIEMIEGKGRRHGKPKIRLPYRGPELCELWIESWASLDEAASGVQLEKVCGTCGFRYYKSKHSGLVLPEGAVPSSIFRLEQFPSPLYCIADVRDFIISEGYSNISFRNVCDGKMKMGSGLICLP